MKKWLFILCAGGLFLPSSAPAQHFSNIDDPGRKVVIAVVPPGEDAVVGAFSYVDIRQIYREDLMPQGVHAHDYKIDWWVYGALQHFGLSFDAETVEYGDHRETTITRIGKHANGPEGKWVFYVNKVRSPYFISTQMDTNLERIEFVYEKQ